MEERWKAWRKEDLPQGPYRLVSLFQGWDGLYLIFESHGIKVEIFYEWAFLSVRSRCESESYKIREQLLAAGGKDFLENKLLYIVKHSEFKKWLVEETVHIYREEEFEHHVFVAENTVIDVLACYDPKVRILKNNRDSICGDSIISYEADFVSEILEMRTRQKDSDRKRTIRFYNLLTYEFEGILQHNEIAGIEACTIDAFLGERAEQLAARKAEGWPIEYESMEELKEYLTEQKYKYIKILSSCGLSGWILAKCFEVR